MRLPFLQVASEVKRLASDLSTLLDWNQAEAGWGLITLFDWALDRCPDHEPPSANDVVDGKNAARQIARAAGWKGDPTIFIDACAELCPPVIERVDTGFRIRGLDRYDAAWGKNNPAKWPAWKKWLAARKSGESAPKPERLRSETVPKPAPNRESSEHHMQTHMQTHMQLPPSEVVEAPPPQKMPGGYEKPTAPVEAWGAREFFAWAQAKRQEAGFIGEREPRGLSGWFSGAIASLRGETALLCEAFYAFGDDKHWQNAKPPLPFVAFMSQWEKFVPRRRRAVS